MEAAGSLIAPDSLTVTNPAPVSPLKVLVDARKLFGGGIGTYVQNLLRGLVQQKGLKVAAILSKSGLELARQKNFAWLDQIEIQIDNARSYSPDEYFNFSKRIKFNCDVFHAPHYTLPFGIPVPTVVTIHDLIHIHYPEKFYYPYVARMMMRSALKRADKIIAVSNSTRRSIEMSFPELLINKQIEVVPNTLKERFLQGSTESAARVISLTQATENLSGNSPYLLSVLSNLKPHKGARDLLRAFRQLLQDSQFAKISLIIAGSGTEQLADRMALMRELGDLQNVHLVGAVSDAELLDLYAGATALVVPSLMEGFCLMVIEAQSQGTTVVARPVPAIRELLLETDICCKDFSQAELVEGMRAALLQGTSDRNQRLLQNQEILRARFDLANLTDSLVQVYRSVAGADRL